MVRVRRIFAIALSLVALAVAPAIGTLAGLGAIRPRLFQHIGHDLHALRFDGPRVQYWHGTFFAVQGVVENGRYYCVQAHPPWNEQYGPPPNRLRHPTGSFNPFDDSTRMGFSAHPWWPPMGTPIGMQTYGARAFPGPDGAQVQLESGPQLRVYTVMSWFVLLVASVPWMVVTGAVVLRRVRSCRRSAVGRCGECGYDLRESPERCPECGTPTVHAPSGISGSTSNVSCASDSCQPR